MEKFRNLCEKAFYNKKTKTFSLVGNFLTILTIFSILIIILESVESLSKYHSFFLKIEYFVVAIFSIEYFGRILGSKKKLSYIFSFFGIIDLVSIIPTWLGIANLTPLKSARFVRVLRFLRTIRLLKVANLEKTNVHEKHTSLSVIKLNLLIYFFTLFFTILILASLVYIFEHDTPGFGNIPLSMLRTSEALLGGSISSFVPETNAGYGVFLFARFMGFIFLGFLVNIIGKIVTHILLGSEHDYSELIDGE